MTEQNKNINISEEEVKKVLETAIEKLGEEGADDIVINFGCGKEAN